MIIIAFYMRNDALDSFKLAYGVPAWNELVTDTTLSSNEVPAINFPPLLEEQWKVRFVDGIETVFTPELRLVSNNNHPAVDAGYKIMADVAERISLSAKKSNVRVDLQLSPQRS